MDHHPGASTLRRTGCAGRTLALASAAILLGGCAVRGARPPVPAPARPQPGYERRVDDLGSVDVRGLVGRRIAIDPGHGGFFPGALGLNGLTEAEVNLGVALHLRGLLEARGAEVLLTRTDDRDFLGPADSSLRGDLAARIQVANAFRPDLFLSIHHNADARGARDVNETQTYYKLGDDGPSLDAAQSVHRYLVRNLGVAAHRILPGNYFVLRQCEAPALLTESSYITHPDVEARLALAAKQRLEAEALLLGIAHYFSRTRPIIESFTASDSDLPPADTLITASPGPVIDAVIDGPFDHVELRLNGVVQPFTRRGGRVQWRPREPWAPGRHVAAIQPRLSFGGAARERTLTFVIRRSPQAIRHQAHPPAASPEGGLLGIKVEVVDAYGFPVGDSLSIELSAVCACDTVLSGTLGARQGVAWGYIKYAPRDRRPAGCEGEIRLTLRVPETDVEVGRVPETRAAVPMDSNGRRWRAAFLHAMPGGGRLSRPPGSGAAPERSWVNDDGFGVCPVLDETQSLPAPFLPGYRPWPAEETLSGFPTRWVAIAGGALHGRRIVVDPDGGGGDAAGTGPSGTRAANVNLQVARALHGLLSAAGAEVRITRPGDHALSDVERVQISEQFGADRFLRIGHRAEPPRIGHYYSSASGRRWAAATSRELARFGFRAARPAEDAQYPLQQTSCPALYVAAERIDVSASEERLLSPGMLRAEAYAIYVALARDLAGDVEWPQDSVEIRDTGGKPVAGAAVTMGGYMTFETDARGRVRFARTEPGPIEVEVNHAGGRLREVLLDSQRGVVLTGPQGR